MYGMFYKEILDNLYEGVYFVDKERTILYWNKAAERISGYSAEDVVGKHCFDNILNHVDSQNHSLCMNGCPLYHTIHDGLQREAAVYLRHKEGYRVYVAVRTIPLYRDGAMVGAIEVFINDNEKAEINNTINEFRNLALTDALTNLPNRRYIDSFLANRIAEFQSLHIPFAVAMIDIDHFRQFNNIYGHDVGDQALRIVSTTMKNALRSSDMIGRWGGEEFFAVLVAITTDDIFQVIDKVRTLVERSEFPHHYGQLRVSVSIGATLVTLGDTVESIQKRADEALYVSKNNGRNQTTIL